MQAVIRTGSKQYIVKEGDEILVEFLSAGEGEEVSLDVLAIMDGAASKVGAPLVDGAKVSAKVLGREKGEKIRIMTFKPKKHSRKRKGHRQGFTRLKVTSVSAG